MQKKNVLFFLLLMLALGALISGCTTTKNTGVAIKEGATEAGQQVGDKAEDLGKEIEDGSITSAIKMKFANDELVSASDIDVDTNKGHVTLNGTVKSKAEADRALQIARSVDGVKTVHSNLTIAAGSN